MALVLYLGESTFSNSNPDCDPNPVFCLCGCAINDITVSYNLDPALKRLKAKFFGDEDAVADLTALVERREEAVAAADAEGEDSGNIDLPSLFSTVSMTVTAVAIQTEKYRGRLQDQNVYWHALPIIMERFNQILKPDPDVASMKALSRGEELDHVLESEYQRIKTQGTDRRLDWEFTGIRGLSFATREENVSGLQISELIAYALARHVSALDGSDGLFDLVKGKLFGGRHGRKVKYGLKVLPKTEINYVD